MTEEILGDNFDFYLRFAKPLVLNLPNTNERVLAAAWVKKLINEASGAENVRKEYLKLLLFSLHRRRLTKPFLLNPEEETLQDIQSSNAILEVAREIILKEDKERLTKLKDGLGGGDYPPYSIECSADLLEYAAAQDIPKFGVHAYYAISLEPISRWDNADKGLLPKGVVPEGPPQPDATVTSSAKVPGDEEVGEGPKTPKRTLKPPTPRPPTARILKRPRSSDQTSAKQKVKFPSRPVESPFGSRPPTDDRTPVTWGSNLIEVTEPPDRDLLMTKSESMTSTTVSATAFSSSSKSGDVPYGDIFDDMPAIYRSPSSSPSSHQPIPQINIQPPTLPRMPSPRQPASQINIQSPIPPRMPSPRQQVPHINIQSPTSTRMPSPRQRIPEITIQAPAPYTEPRISPRGRESPRPLPIPPGASAESREIIQEAKQSLAEMPQNVADVDMSAFDHLYPGRRPDMPLTPPMFSRFQAIREGPGRRVQYEPQQFDLTGQEGWQSGSEFQFERKPGGTTPTKPTRLKFKKQPKPVEKVFPRLMERDQWSEVFFDAQQPVLVAEDEEEEEPVMEDLETRLHRLMTHIGGRSREVPVAAGVTVTTPGTTASPARSKLYGSDYPIFEEVIPEYKSPVMSPESRAAQQMMSLISPPAARVPAPASPRTPTLPTRTVSPIPPRDPNIDEYGLPRFRNITPGQESPGQASARFPTPPIGARSQQSPYNSQGQPQGKEKSEKAMHGKMDSPGAKKKQSPGKKGAPAPLRTVEELQAVVDAQHGALYGTLVAEQPPPPRAMPQDLMGHAAALSPREHAEHILERTSPTQDIQVPPMYPSVEIPGWQTPPHTVLQREDTPSPVLLPQSRAVDMLSLELPPEEVFQHLPETPPTPPPQVSYDDHYDPFEMSGPFVDLEAIAISDLVGAHEMVPYGGAARGRGHDRKKKVKIPAPSRTGRPINGQMIEEEPEYSYVSPVKTHALGKVKDYYTSVAPVPPTTAAAIQPVDAQGIMTEVQEHFVSEFDDPRQQEQVRRVLRLVEDVVVEGEEPLLQTQEQYERQVAAELPDAPAVQDLYMSTPPQAITEIYQVEETLEDTPPPARVSPAQHRPPSPPLEIPQFGFQGHVGDFMPEHRRYELPKLPARAGASPQRPPHHPRGFEDIVHIGEFPPIGLDEGPVTLDSSPPQFADEMEGDVVFDENVERAGEMFPWEQKRQPPRVVTPRRSPRVGTPEGAYGGPWAIASPSRPQARLSPRPQDRLSPRPQDRLSPRPQDILSPRPQDRLSPRPQDRLSPRPQAMKSPRPQDRLSPRPQIKSPPKSQNISPTRPQLPAVPYRTPSPVVYGPLTPTAQRIQDMENKIYAQMSPLKPSQYPDDLMGFAIRPISPRNRAPIMDRISPGMEGLPQPMQPPVEVPGWQTPPHLKRTPERRPTPPHFVEAHGAPNLEQELMPPDVFMIPTAYQESQQSRLPDDYFPLATEMPDFFEPEQQLPLVRTTTTKTFEQGQGTSRTTSTSRTEQVRTPSPHHLRVATPSPGLPTPSPPPPGRGPPTPPSSPVVAQARRINALAAEQYNALFEDSPPQQPTSTVKRTTTIVQRPASRSPQTRRRSPSPHVTQRPQPHVMQGPQPHVMQRPQPPSVFDNLEAGPDVLLAEEFPEEWIPMGNESPGALESSRMQEIDVEIWPEFDVPQNEAPQPWEKYSTIQDVETYEAPQFSPQRQAVDPNLGFLERNEQMVADVDLPDDLTMPAASPLQQLAYQSPEWSPGLPPHGTHRPALEDEMFFEGDLIPQRTSPSPDPRRPSPNIFTTEALGEVEGIMEEEEAYVSPIRSPPIRSSPVRSPRREPIISPGTAAEAAGIRFEVASHEYTEHMADRERALMRRQVRSGGHVVNLGRQPPGVGILAEVDEPEESPPRRRSPIYVREETIIEVPADEVGMQQSPASAACGVIAAADEQYAQLLSPPQAMERFEAIPVETYDPRYMHILDEPRPIGVSMNLPLAMADQTYVLTSPPAVDEPLASATYYVPWRDPALPENRLMEIAAEEGGVLESTPPFDLMSPGQGAQTPRAPTPRMLSPSPRAPSPRMPTPRSRGASPRRPTPRRPDVIFEEAFTGKQNFDVSPQLYISPLETATPEMGMAQMYPRQVPRSATRRYSPEPLPELVRFEEPRPPRGAPIVADDSYVFDDQPYYEEQEDEYEQVQMGPMAPPRRRLFDDSSSYEVESPARSPVRSPARSPVRSPARSPVRSPARSPVRSPARSPVQHPLRSPMRPPVGTPGRSPGAMAAIDRRSPVNLPREDLNEAFFSDDEEIPMFEGNFQPGIHDTSDIPIEEEDTGDFRWMGDYANPEVARMATPERSPMRVPVPTPSVFMSPSPIIYGQWPIRSRAARVIEDPTSPVYESLPEDFTFSGDSTVSEPHADSPIPSSYFHEGKQEYEQVDMAPMAFQRRWVFDEVDSPGQPPNNHPVLQSSGRPATTLASSRSPIRPASQRNVPQTQMVRLEEPQPFSNSGYALFHSSFFDSSIGASYFDGEEQADIRPMTPPKRQDFFHSTMYDSPVRSTTQSSLRSPALSPIDHNPEMARFLAQPQPLSYSGDSTVPQSYVNSTIPQSYFDSTIPASYFDEKPRPPRYPIADNSFMFADQPYYEEQEEEYEQLDMAPTGFRKRRLFDDSSAYEVDSHVRSPVVSPINQSMVQSSGRPARSMRTPASSRSPTRPASRINSSGPQPQLAGLQEPQSPSYSGNAFHSSFFDSSIGSLVFDEAELAEIVPTVPPTRRYLYHSNMYDSPVQHPMQSPMSPIQYQMIRSSRPPTPNRAAPPFPPRGSDIDEYGLPRLRYISSRSRR